MKIANLIKKGLCAYMFSKSWLASNLPEVEVSLHSKRKSVSIEKEVTLSYFAAAQTEKLKMLTSLHIDWEGDFISIPVILTSGTYEIVKGLEWTILLSRH